MTYAISVTDLERRMARLLSLPRAEKARLASPHPYRGWRQWPDDFGRLELERFNVAQYDSRYGRPDQIAAWRDGTPYVAGRAANLAGR